MKKQVFFWAILLILAIMAAPAAAEDQSKKEKKFIEEAARGGMFEVEAGTLAIERASNEEVREFGRMMVTDHGKANADLRAVAEAQNIELPTEMGKEYEKNMDKLRDASDEEFDRKYMKIMAKDHEEDVKKFRKMQDKIENPELKAFVDDTLPVLENHLERARTLKKAVKG